MPSTQPAANYREYRQERSGDLGRGRGVPSMITRLDAREHNYSSARFDRGLLHQSATHLRSTLYTPRLKRLARRVIAEAVLVGILPPPPVPWRIGFIWPAMPQVDEKKAADAEAEYLSHGTLPWSVACATRHGMRASDVIRMRQRDIARLTAAGLPTDFGRSGSPADDSDPDQPGPLDAPETT